MKTLKKCAFCGRKLSLKQFKTDRGNESEFCKKCRLISSLRSYYKRRIKEPEKLRIYWKLQKRKQRTDKIVTYVLMVAQYFPKTHPKAGIATYFEPKIRANDILDEMCKYWDPKLHTIRNNYELWKRRIDRVNEGGAVLELRYWEGRPYHTNQITFKTLKQGEVGIQKLQRKITTLVDDRHYVIDGDTKPNLKTETLAKNDGLGVYDFIDWFVGGFGVEPKAIIHFTKFRY